jgi:hypothetical protein
MDLYYEIYIKHIEEQKRKKLLLIFN